jgi:hypothetical protein
MVTRMRVLPYFHCTLFLGRLQLSSEGPKAEVAGGEPGGGGDGGGDDVMAKYTSWELPSREFEGLWESLVYDPEPPIAAATDADDGVGGGRGVKESLLSYASSALAFSDARVDSNLVSWNHVVLLHGPPGTGCVRRNGGGGFDGQQCVVQLSLAGPCAVVALW